MSGGGSDTTIGFRYFMGLHMAIAHGPVDSINRIYVAERSLDITGQTGNATITVDQRDLFGGDEKEGGIVGDLDFEFGGATQLPNAYLTTQFGAGITPAFRGVTCVVFRALSNPGLGNRFVSSSGGGYLTAMTPYPKPWAFDVTDIPGGTFNPTKQIVNGTANGGHIIFDSLTDTDWGLGLPEADLDTASFTTVTDALFDEGFGLSMIYAQQSTMEEFITEVLTHINAVLYTDRQTGKFVLRLIRDDFILATLPIFDEANIASLVYFERPSFAEMVNEIIITYRRQGAFEDTSITAQDLASIQAQQGIVSQTSDFPGLDDDNIAARVAQRELKQLSTPLARVRIIANREAWEVSPGDVIKLSWATYGIVEVVLRVASVDYGTLENGLVGIDAVEDVFGLPANTYLVPQDTGWSDEVGDPVPAPTTLAIELPFFVIETTFAQEILNALVSESSILQSIAENPAVATFAFQLHTRQGAADFENVASGQFAPTSQLVGALIETTTTSINIKNFKGGLGEVVIGGYAYLNDEVLRVDSVDLTNNLLDVGRGYLDSIPQSHPLDSTIYFADSNDGIDPEIYVETDSVDAKVLTQTSIGVLPLASAVTDNLVMAGRRNKPYGPAQVRLGGLFFPASLTDQISIAVTWTHQDRTQQLAIGGSDWFTTSLASPEAGVLYEVRYFDDVGATLLFTDSNIAGTFSSFTPATAIGVPIDIRVEVDAIRDGTIFNTQTFKHVTTYTKPLAVRALPNGDIRVLPNADRRILP